MPPSRSPRSRRAVGSASSGHEPARGRTMNTREEPFYVRALYWLEHADRLVYSLIAMLFLAAAVAMTLYSVATFVAGQQEFPLRLVIFVNVLLLVLIIL